MLPFPLGYGPIVEAGWQVCRPCTLMLVHLDEFDSRRSPNGALGIEGCHLYEEQGSDLFSPRRHQHGTLPQDGSVALHHGIGKQLYCGYEIWSFIINTEMDHIANGEPFGIRRQLRSRRQPRRLENLVCMVAFVAAELSPEQANRPGP